ncbi:sugar transferase [Nocardia stercoris]|uniref:Sugar transferase n=1 Tax=Nocardia stercoris TaxID=2483361 RepID=A0A3M2L654_9NOCA|nr:sugar transferase [Nocardia stercoris]RMI32200.1 sugar transferase [Nocardia stercoris]
MSFEVRAQRAVSDITDRRPVRGTWRRAYVRRLQVSDIVIVALAVGAAQVLRFGDTVGPPLALTAPLEVRYTVVSVVLGVAWAVCLTASGSRAERVIGSGTEEYRRLVGATLQLFGAVAIGSLLLRVDVARGYLAIALPLGLIGLMMERRLWRQWVSARRATGEFDHRVLVVGSRSAAAATAAAFSRSPEAGYRVVGLCTPGIEVGPEVTVDGRAIPVLGDDLDVLTAVRRSDADTVAVTATDNIGPGDLRRMAWELDPLGVELIVTSGLADIASVRLTHTVIADMPMLHVEKPRYDRAKSARKSVFDVCFALTALILIAPVLVAIAIAVKVTSPGPVFYQSERIGRGGKPFRMIKFRSMYADADAHISALIDAQGGNPVFFKLRDDPRVTPVGRVIRKFSLDELPQFFNVLRGEMSVVGPRPQVQREVDSYDGTMRRRLLVKPGVTGLWQVSGRSDLSPEDAMRLDLNYVENWSMVLDLLLVAKTIGAVTRGDGAY